MSSVKKINGRSKVVPSGQRLGGIANGAADDDAVNMSQLNTLQAEVDAIESGSQTLAALTVTGTTDTTSGTTGAINTLGGIGVTKSVFAGTSVITDLITEKTAGNGTPIKTHVISAGAATLAPTNAQSGSVIALAKADGVTVTLPALSATNIGIKYRFQVAISCTSVGYVINTTGTDVFLGGIYGTIANNSVAGDSLFSTSTANKTITLDATTKCGLIGGWVEVCSVSATQWMVTGVTLGTGAIATPFSN